MSLAITEKTSSVGYQYQEDFGLSLTINNDTLLRLFTK